MAEVLVVEDDETLRETLRDNCSEPDGAEVLAANGLELDLGQCQASLDGTEVTLTPKEFELLAYLPRNRGRVFSRQQPLDRVWGYDHVSDARTVDVHVRRLREEIEVAPSHPRRLQTVRGVGYRLAL